MTYCDVCERDFSYESEYETICEGCSSWFEEKGLLRVYCKGSNCCQKVKNWEQYCSDCQTYCSHSSCLNYSKQVEERPSTSAEYSHYSITTNYGKCDQCKNGKVNNGENGIFCLRDGLNQYLSQKDDYRSQEIERRYLQEVPAKDNGCQVM